jgi:hypothetical protein
VDHGKVDAAFKCQDNLVTLRFVLYLS